MENAIQIGKINGKESRVLVDNNLVTLCSCAEKTNKCSFRNDGMLSHMHHEADIGFIEDYTISDPVLIVKIEDGKITYKFSAYSFEMLPMQQNELLKSVKSAAASAELFYDKLKANSRYQLNNFLQEVAENVLEKALNFDLSRYDGFEIRQDKSRLFSL